MFFHRDVSEPIGGPVVTDDRPKAELPPLSPRLSKAIEEVGSGRESWPSRLRAELGDYVVQLRNRGMTPERSLASVKQIARPLFEHSERLRTQVVSWVLDAYYDRRPPGEGTTD